MANTKPARLVTTPSRLAAETTPARTTKARPKAITGVPRITNSVGRSPKKSMASPKASTGEMENIGDARAAPTMEMAV